MHRINEISKRLREWGLGEFGSLAGFARALGVTQQTLNDYTSGRSKPGNKMQTRLRALGCDVEWLMLGPVEAEVVADSGSNKMVKVGWANFEGRVLTSNEGNDVWDHRKIPKGAGIPYRRGRFFCLEIGDDTLLSAEPTPIHPGDVCIFEADRRAKNGDVVAVRFKKGKLVVRVMKHLSQHEVELAPANKYRTYRSFKVRTSSIKAVGVLKSIVQLSEGEKKFFGIRH